MFEGATFEVSGWLPRTVDKSYSFAGLEAPREYWSWPVVGGVEGLPPDLADKSTYALSDGSIDEYLRPKALLTEVQSDLGTAEFIQSTKPPVGESADLLWRSREPVEASARVADIDQVSFWQQVTTVLNVIMALSLGILATVLLDQVRARLGQSSTSFSDQDDDDDDGE